MRQIFPALVFFCFLCACTKSSNSHSPQVSGPAPHYYNITWYAHSVGIQQPNIFLGDTVSVIVWGITDSFVLHFGDGYTTTDTFSKHLYTDTGIYHLVITKGSDTLSKRDIQILSGPDSSIIAAMFGLKYWHGNSSSLPGVYDTFEVTKLGRGMIIIKGDTLQYTGTHDTATSTPYLYYHGSYGPPYSGREFYYYYKGDSTYTTYWFPQGGIFLHTP